MSENNGILYVFEHVSVSQQAQMEGDSRGGDGDSDSEIGIR